MSNYDIRYVYKTEPPSVDRYATSRILPCSTPPPVNYALRTYNAGEETFHFRLERVLEKEIIEQLLEYFVLRARYGIRY